MDFDDDISIIMVSNPLSETVEDYGALESRQYSSSVLYKNQYQPNRREEEELFTVYDDGVKIKSDYMVDKFLLYKYAWRVLKQLYDNSSRKYMSLMMTTISNKKFQQKLFVFLKLRTILKKNLIMGSYIGDLNLMKRSWQLISWKFILRGKRRAVESELTTAVDKYRLNKEGSKVFEILKCKLYIIKNIWNPAVIWINFRRMKCGLNVLRNNILKNKNCFRRSKEFNKYSDSQSKESSDGSFQLLNKYIVQHNDHKSSLENKKNHIFFSFLFLKKGIQGLLNFTEYAAMKKEMNKLAMNYYRKKILRKSIIFWRNYQSNKNFDAMVDQKRKNDFFLKKIKKFFIRWFNSHKNYKNQIEKLNYFGKKKILKQWKILVLERKSLRYNIYSTKLKLNSILLFKAWNCFFLIIKKRTLHRSQKTKADALFRKNLLRRIFDIFWKISVDKECLIRKFWNLKVSGLKKKALLRLFSWKCDSENYRARSKIINEIFMKNEVRRQFCYLFELSKKNKIDNVADRRIELNKRRKLYFLLENALNSKYKKAVLYKNVRNLKHAVHQWTIYLSIIGSNNEHKKQSVKKFKWQCLQKFQKMVLKRIENKIHISEKEEQIIQSIETEKIRKVFNEFIFHCNSSKKLRIGDSLYLNKNFSPIVNYSEFDFRLNIITDLTKPEIKKGIIFILNSILINFF